MNKIIETDKIRELEINTFSGCGLMLAKMKDDSDDIILCRF